MAFLVGLVLALGVGAMATVFRLDRERAFYTTVLIVVGSYYALFAVMGGTTRALVVETMVAMLFLGASLAGFKSSLWIVVGGLAAHGVFDSVHGYLISNPGVPVWWPAFCGTYDVVAAAYLAVLLSRRQVRTMND